MDKRLYLSLDVTLGDRRTSYNALKRAAAAAQEAATDALIAEGLDVTRVDFAVEWRYVWHESDGTTDYEDGSSVQAFATTAEV